MTPLVLANATAPGSCLDLPTPGWGMTLVDALVPSLAPDHPLANLDLAPGKLSYPIYFFPRADLIPGFSDRYLSLALPFLGYWAMALSYLFLDWVQWPVFEQYRMRDPNEGQVRNRVKLDVVAKAVLSQQVLQTFIGCLSVEPNSVGLAQVFRDHKAHIRAVGVVMTRIATRLLGTSLAHEVLHLYGTAISEIVYWWVVPMLHLLYALYVKFLLHNIYFILDTYQYFMHRLFHESRFLYKHVHSYHHKLIVTHAVGAIYNHWFEGLMMDTCSAVATYLFCRLTIRQGILVFTLSTLKTVNDHGGFDFPFWINPINCIFPNTIDYHDIHHQPQGFRYNFSQPYFIHWDELMGTRMHADQVNKLNAFQKLQKWKERSPKTTPAAMNEDRRQKEIHPADNTSIRHRPDDTTPARDTSTTSQIPTSANHLKLTPPESSYVSGLNTSLRGNNHSVADKTGRTPKDSFIDAPDTQLGEKETSGKSPVAVSTALLSGGHRDLILTPASLKARRHRSLPASSSMLLGSGWGSNSAVNMDILRQLASQL